MCVLGGGLGFGAAVGRRVGVGEKLDVDVEVERVGDEVKDEIVDVEGIMELEEEDVDGFIRLELVVWGVD